MSAHRNSLTPIVSALLAAFLLCTTAGCEKALKLKTPAAGPAAVFEDLWNELDQHYSLFPYKGINWDSCRQQFQSRIKNDMPDNALFHLLTEMLATLKDGHITLSTSVDTFTYLAFYQDYPPDFNYNNIVNNYLKNDYSTSGPVIYKIENNIGYLYYRSFEEDITDQQIDKILTDMTSTKGLIVDVRSNTGGTVQNADKLFSRFITAKTLVKYEMEKKGTGHSDFGQPQPYYIAPAGQHYDKPVIVLTNRSCFSACNDFALYMSELGNVRLMGDQTGGGGGLPKNYILSNGWMLQYTSTVTLSPLKQPIENGILPTVHIDISSIEDSNGQDPILEKAFQSIL